MPDSEHISKDTTYDGLLLYTDGSSDQRRGIIGWAAHGYLYNNELPKRGAGHPKVVPTSQGYLLKAEAKDKMITPISYINIIGSTTKQGTNNTAEALGFLDGLKFARDYRVKNILVRPDSEYVINGFTKWLPAWVQNNWIKKATGEPIPNKEVWQEILSTWNDLKTNGANISFKWVKGHSGEFGNEMADKFASIGRSKSTQGQDSVEVMVHKPEGFFKGAQERHPLICLPSVLFCTDPTLNPQNGYILTNLTKTEEMVGRNDTDAVVAYCELKKTDELIDIVQKCQIAQANDVPSLVMLRYDRIFIENRAEDIAMFSEHTLKRPHRHRVDLYFSSDNSHNSKDPKKHTPITEDLVPIMLADRLWKGGNEIKSLVEKMKEYKAHPELPVEGAEVIDISHLLFRDVKSKKGEMVRDLHTNVTPTTRELLFRHNCRNRMTDYRLVMGLHIPRRNTLKRISEAKDMQAWMILLHVSNDAERYMTVFHADGEWLGYSAYSSNLVIHRDNPLV